MTASNRPRTLAVGVTGAIGSGKSQVCRYFEELGARAISADDVAKRLLDTDAALKSEVRKAFGAAVYRPDGTLDRKQMAKRIFQDPELRTKLESIVHPETLRAISDEMDRIEGEEGPPMIVVEAALIFEARADAMFDYIIVVDAPEEERIGRVMARDKASRHDVLERELSQMPAEEKLRKADFALKNAADLPALKRNAGFLYSLLLHISKTGDADDQPEE